MTIRRASFNLAFNVRSRSPLADTAKRLELVAAELRRHAELDPLAPALKGECASLGVSTWAYYATPSR